MIRRFIRKNPLASIVIAYILGTAVTIGFGYLATPEGLR